LYSHKAFVIGVCDSYVSLSCSVLTLYHVVSQTTKGRGAYEVPKYGRLVYSGVAGAEYVFANIRRHNDLGHSLCANLREGTWLGYYQLTRMKSGAEFTKLAAWLEPLLKDLDVVPSSYRPMVFGTIIHRLFQALTKRAMQCMSEFVLNGDDFVQALALTSVALVGTDTADLSLEKAPTIAAGLPHFAVGWARSWGRDTFIALRGLLLVTHRFDVAKLQITLFAECIRHGLVPNLFNGGENPRYNARDAVWWFLQAVQDYCSFVPNGESILQTSINMRFPHSDKETHSRMGGACHPRLLCDIIQDIMERHAAGISFREWGAGLELDREMTEDGFNVTVRLDRATGLLYGGVCANQKAFLAAMAQS
jgi:glycogen debranching enzyme